MPKPEANPHGKIPRDRASRPTAAGPKVAGDRRAKDTRPGAGPSIAVTNATAKEKAFRRDAG